MTLRALLVDDEPLALQRLVYALSAIEDVEIVGTAEDGRAALDLAERLRPDLILLDIEIPYCNGIEVGQALSAHPETEIIFVTALDEFALEAFRLRAVDYLLKPVQPDRLAEAMQRARLRHEQRLAKQDAQAALDAPAQEGEAFFWVPQGEGNLQLPAREIRRIEAARDYALLYTKAHTFILKTTMKELESRLDGQPLLRVHRSAFVRPDIVVEAEFSGRRVVCLHTEDGAVIDVASKYAEEVQSALDVA